MKRRSFLHYTLELIVILGSLVLGVTIYSFRFDPSRIFFDRIFIGILIIAIGFLELVDYITWKYATKIRSIQSLISALLALALGTLFLIIIKNMKVVCYLWGGFSIAFALIRISTASINLVFQPLMNSAKIIFSIMQIIFSILLLTRTLNGIESYVLFLGAGLIAQAIVLFIEFIIHRYQHL